jgi:hypothetical protein
VTWLRTSVAALEAQARTREEGAQKQVATANKLLATSSAQVNALEGDLRTTTVLLETSRARVAVLEVALGDAYKLLEVTRVEGKQASKGQLKLEARVEADATN